MKNPGAWSVYVWKSAGGWCYNLHAANISLSETDHGCMFWALVSADHTKPGSGLAAWGPERDIEHADPNVAVEYAVKAAVDYATNLLFEAHAANMVVKDSNAYAEDVKKTPTELGYAV